MSVLKWAECHVTLANEGAVLFSVGPMLALDLMGVMSKQLLHTVLHTVGQHIRDFWLREKMF